MKKVFIYILLFMPFAGFSQRLFNITSMQKPSGAPTIGISPTSLPNFTNTTGTASLPQNVSYSVSGLTGTLAISLPSGFEGSINGGSSYTTSFSGLTTGGTLMVRVAASTATGSYSGNVAFSSTGATTQNCAVTATVSAVSPSLSVTPSSLTGFNTPTGTQSASQTFNISGTNLTANVTVTAPASYVVSLDGISFTSSVMIVPSGGSVSAQITYVAISSSASVGSPSGNVSVASTGATTRNVAVSGTVTGGGSAIDTIVAQFNFNNTAQSVSGWTDASATNLGLSSSSTIYAFTDPTNYLPVTITFVPFPAWKGTGSTSSSTNTGGFATPSFTNFPSGVIASYFFNENTTTWVGGPTVSDSMAIISGLDNTKYYSFDFACSRATGTARNMTIYLFDSTGGVRVDSLTINAANNSATPLHFKNKKPSGGKIWYSVHPVAGSAPSNFGYTNAMIATKQVTLEDFSATWWLLIIMAPGMINLMRRKKREEQCG